MKLLHHFYSTIGVRPFGRWLLSGLKNNLDIQRVRPNCWKNGTQMSISENLK